MNGLSSFLLPCHIISLHQSTVQFLLLFKILYVQSISSLSSTLLRRFLTAALGTFGAIRLSHNAAEIPTEMRRRFSEVTEERNIMLHDKLESQNK